MTLKDSMYGKFYGCSTWKRTGCKGSMSADEKTGVPIGVPARAATKAARTRAHRAFDVLWTGGRMTRKQAYAWIQKVMKLSKREAHIANFTLEQCERLITEVERLYPERSR
jgi:hypothetical protein